MREISCVNSPLLFFPASPFLLFSASPCFVSKLVETNLLLVAFQFFDGQLTFVRMAEKVRENGSD
jgi:hypothetical protein